MPLQKKNSIAFPHHFQRPIATNLALEQGSRSLRHYYGSHHSRNFCWNWRRKKIDFFSCKSILIFKWITFFICWRKEEENFSRIFFTDNFQANRSGNGVADAVDSFAGIRARITFLHLEYLQSSVGQHLKFALVMAHSRHWSTDTAHL